MKRPEPDRFRTGARVRSRPIPEATVARLPVYLRVLRNLGDQNLQTISSERLADAAGVNAPKVRKDLSYLGSYGTRGVGYDVEYLIYQISRELGLTQDWLVAIVGVGNLGHALAGYKGFQERGFRVDALFDRDDSRVGERIGHLVIEHIDDLDRSLKERGISIAIVATPATAAQETADRLVAAGVRSILNVAPTVLTVPNGIHLRQVDLSVELQILAFYELRKAGRAKRKTPSLP
jgi:redox-sensing transcriptional repressor